MKTEFLSVPGNITPKQAGDLKKLKTMSVEFESFFMKEVVKAMRDTVPKNSLLDGGNAEEIYRSMYDDNLAGEMAKSGSSGIAQTLYKQLSSAYMGKAQTQGSVPAKAGHEE